MRLTPFVFFVGAAGAAAQTPRLDPSQMAAISQAMTSPAQFVLQNAAELALTPDQVQRLTALSVALSDSVAPRTARIQRVFSATLGQSLGSSVSWTGPIDEEQIREGARRQSAAQAETMINIARDRHAVANILTSSQVALLPRIERAVMMRSTRPGGTTAAPGGNSGNPYFEFQVDKRVTQVRNGVTPSYPAALRAENLSGEVVAQFVVDTSGHIEAGSFKAIRSAHALFTDSVREALTRMEFTPAELGGKKVRQLMQHPFYFKLTP